MSIKILGSLETLRFEFEASPAHETMLRRVIDFKDLWCDFHPLAGGTFMKILLLSLLILPIDVLSNPFDQFVGTYESSSSAVIQTENADKCIRYAFNNLRSIEITKSNGEGSKQTHNVKFSSVLNHSPFSVGLPIMDYRNELGLFNPKDVVSYAKTSGGSTLAFNEQGTETKDRIEKLTIKITAAQNGLNLEMNEILIDLDGKHLCTYEMQFRKL